MSWKHSGWLSIGVPEMNNKQLLLDSFTVVYDNRRRFAQALAFPFTMLVVLDMTELLDMPEFIGWLFAFFAILIYANFAIVTHRLVILGDESVPKYGITSLSKRELLFSAYMIGIPMGLAAPLVIISYILDGAAASVVTILGACAYVYILARFSLVFPGTAIDKWVTISRSWKMSAHHQGSMLLVVIFFPILIGLLLSLPFVLLSLVLPHAVVLALVSLSNTLLLVFTITILSLAYKEITRLEAST